MTQPDDMIRTPLEDWTNVMFVDASDNAPGTGFTPAEIEAFFNMSFIPNVPVLTASAGDQSLYTTAETGGETMPWRIVSNSVKCGDEKPFAVVKEMSGEVEGCHATHAEAASQLRALYASEDASADTTTAVPNEPAPIAANEVTWTGVLAVEGVETGDGRMFAEGSLNWRDLPIPLMYQRVTSHGGQTDETVNVGRIDQIWRDGNKIMGKGAIDVGDVNGAEAARKMGGKFLNGVSIDADSIKEADIEYVFPEGDGDAGDDELAELFGPPPDMMIFHKGRISAATLVNIPAFAEASLYLDGEEALVAAAHVIEIPDLPPAHWFEEPTELPPIGAVWVTDEGRIFGLVGPGKTAHRAYKDKVITIPMGNVDYSAWMNRPTIIEGGQRINCGVITMNCGHVPPPPYGSMDAGVRMEQYDNTCSIAAVVRIGESKKHGAPWIAGKIMPMSPEDLERFMACQLSGDWAPHREKPRMKEFVAALTVPVPGFARSTRGSVRADSDGVVVASAVPIRRWEEKKVEEVIKTDEGSNRMALGGIRARLSGGNRTQLAAIRDRVRTTANPSRTTAQGKTEDPAKRGVKMGSDCTPCQRSRERRNQQTSAQVSTAPGFGEGDGEAAAQQSVNNAISNKSRTRRG